MRFVAILGGCDWNDASVDHLAIPDGMELEAMRSDYNDWYRTEYCPAINDPNRDRRQPLPVRYMTFPEFLISRGARYAMQDEIEVYGE